MFAERLNQLFLALDASNAAIARYADFDRTNVSRLRNGRRIPAPHSRTSLRLVHGLVACALEEGKTAALCRTIGQDSAALLHGGPQEAAGGGTAAPSPGAERQALEAALLQWLYDGEDYQKAALMPSPAPPPRATGNGHRFSFSRRLDQAMTLADLSNVRLSQLIHVDASLISRYRTGIRTPKENPQLAGHLGDILYERIERNGKKGALAKLMRLPAGRLDESVFLRWLCDFSDTLGADFTYAEHLLEAFDTYSAECGIPLPSPEEAAPESILTDARALYLGTEGLRDAVCRFLGNAAKNGVSRLLLYSDENMDWMVGDPVFRLRWASLMNACVKSGIRIRIIHNIDRGLREMNHAILSWLPLYISGMIEPWYHQKPAGERFSHTLFLCPEQGCISAFHVRGAEDPIYRYDTDPGLLRSHEAAYRRLLDDALPLVTITPFVSLGHIPPPGAVDIIQGCLSIATMPEELVAQFGVPSLTEEWSRNRAFLLHCLEEGLQVRELIPVEAPETHPPVARFAGCPALTYQPEQYAMHLDGIRQFLEDYPNYRFLRIAEAPFPNMRIMIGADFVTVTRAIAPFFSFRFTHPLMCRAFRDYAERLSAPGLTDPLTARAIE